MVQSPGAFDADKRKFLSALAHASIFVSTLIFSVGLPIGLLIISDDPVVKENAKEAINFHFNVWFYGTIIGVLAFLTFGLMGWFLAPIGFLIHWGLTIWALTHCFSQPDTAFRYPFIFRLL
jgi:uncharacterized Tic20 family protein